MSKRVADRDLNHINWDFQDKPEEAGTFSVASPDVINRRVIKTARRRSSGSNTSLTSKDSPSSVSSPFAILGTNFSSPRLAPRQSDRTRSRKYCAKLMHINKKLREFINKQLDDNSCVILTPAFEDYNNYIETLEKEERERSQDDSSSDEDSGVDKLEKNIHGKKKHAVHDSEAKMSPKEKSSSLFSGHLAGENKSILVKNVSSPTCSAVSTSGKIGTFMPSTSTSFFSPPQKSDSSFSGSDKEQDTESSKDEEHVPATEEGSVFSKKCKVYMKKGENFQDHGVGMLHLKPIEESNKTQLIVRANTSIGKLLTNLVLSASIPITKRGKNNIMMVCVPKPGDDPTTVLIRVKTSEEAEELINILNKHKDT